MRLLVCLVLLSPASAIGQTLTVFAASSLTDAFTEVAAAFETATPGTRVLLSFAGSSTLSSQLLQGAPADVFASADEVQMTRVSEAGLTSSPSQVFALNLLTVVTPLDSELDDLADLALPGWLLVLAAPEVPAGRYARELLMGLDDHYGAGFSERVQDNVVSEEPNVRQVTAKIALGEADAAIIYRSDLLSTAGVRELPLPAGAAPVARYPIAPLSAGRHPELARSFSDFVLSAEGQLILSRHGFTPP